MFKRRKREAGKLGILETMMFGVMGPPQLGDVNAPIRERPARPVERCGRCRLPYEDHEVVRDPGLTYTRCPEPS
ncbi:MAG: hypothetical protein JWO60_2152 [Frankiales bacterium]|nr:hypothetical protein [Frankiales bacterium]